MLKLLKLIFSIFIVIAAAAAGYVVYAYNTPGVNDDLRLKIKRFRAESPYTFEEIAPHFTRTDAASLITVHAHTEIEENRQKLSRAIFGAQGFPHSRLPNEVVADARPAGFADTPYLAASYRLDTFMEFGVRKPSYLLIPQQTNGELIIYQHGYAGTIDDVQPHISKFLQEGYTVLAMNLLGYDKGFGIQEAYVDGIGFYRVNSKHALLYVDEHPLRYWFEPAIASLNWALQQHSYKRIVMIGFSMGGWTTQVLAGLDPRINASYSVAGGYPLFLRSQERNETPPPALHHAIIREYMNLYVMAADTPSRKTVHIFNQFDRCCYRNKKVELYAPSVQQVLANIKGGEFKFWLDTSHADHKISEKALAYILSDMQGKE